MALRVTSCDSGSVPKTCLAEPSIINTTTGLLQGIAFAEYTVAEVKGFWEQQGVSVKLIESAVPLDSMRARLQRRFDLGLMPMPFMSTYRNEGLFDAAYVGIFSIPTRGKAVILLSDDQIRAFTKVEKFVDPQTLLEHNQHLLRDYFAQFRTFLVTEGSLQADVLNAFTYENVIHNQALLKVLQEYVQ